MAGKHRRPGRRNATRGASSAKRGLVPGLAGAAVAATTVSTALITGTTITVAPPEVTLAALVTPANSTSQILAGKVYYGEDQTQVYGPQTVVPFFLGPRGIVWAVQSLEDETADPETPNALFASGWGAGQASTALAMMDEEDLAKLDVVVLDNNTNRAGGGFWTTYAIFAPLLLTSAEPTPNDLSVQVIDVAYQYNINSNAPTNPLNLFATANSLVAYVYNYGGEQTAPMPDEDLDTAGVQLKEGYHYVVNPDGTIDEELSGPVQDSNVTYVTFKSDGLPLVRAWRSIPGGDRLADALEPTLTRRVEAGYEDGQSIPQDPSEPRPMDLRLWGQQTAEPAENNPSPDSTAGKGVPQKLADLRDERQALLGAARVDRKPNRPSLRGPIDMTDRKNPGGNNPVRQFVDRFGSVGSDARDDLPNAKTDAPRKRFGEHRRSRGPSSETTS